MASYAKFLLESQRGQGFDVFKLLIAAVVAAAILLILLQTLKILPDIGSENPNNAAANTVKSKLNEPGLPQILDDITFSDGDSLNARTIAQQSGALNQDQVCVILSPSAPNNRSFDDKGANGEVVIYNGSLSQKTRLLVMCDSGRDIERSLESYEYDSSPFEINPGSACGDKFNSASSSRFCVVAVVSDQ